MWYLKIKRIPVIQLESLISLNAYWLKGIRLYKLCHVLILTNPIVSLKRPLLWQHRTQCDWWKKTRDKT